MAFSFLLFYLQQCRKDVVASGTFAAFRNQLDKNQNAKGKQAVFENVEEQVRFGVEWLRLLVESLGAAVIAMGIVIAIVGLARHALIARGDDFTPIRLAFARYLTLALELQLAADILSTSVAPTWDRIGKLAAIAVIRTALNFFLSKEIQEERKSEGLAVDDSNGRPKVAAHSSISDA